MKPKTLQVTVAKKEKASSGRIATTEAKPAASTSKLAPLHVWGD